MYAVLHLADFALQAVLRIEPGARSHERERVDPPFPEQPARAAALFSGTGKKSLVLAANAAARAAGVALGMSAPQAVARCPALLIRTPRPAAEAEARAALLAVGFTLAPTIEDTAPGICTIDLRGTDPARHHASAAAALAQLAALALAATAGIARTPLLALYAARESAPDLSPQSFSSSFSLPSEPFLLCESAPETPTDERERKRKEKDSRERSAPTEPPHSRSRNRSRSLPAPRTKNENEERERDQAPPPPRVLAPAAEKAFLAPLALATADPPPELAATLAAWGLRTLGDYTALPRDELVRRFGAAGLALWQRASGGEPRPLHPVAPTREFSAATDLEEPVETLEPLLFLLRRFLDRLALELQGAHAVAAALTLTLRLANETDYTRPFRLPEPTADAGILFRALHTHLESLQTDSPIAGLRLQITPTRPLVRQQGLFETGLRDPHGFAETLARVSALVGADRVGTPQSEDTHRPDAVKLTAPPAVVPPPAAPPLHAPCGLPLRRFRPPLPARLEFSAADRRPSYVWTERFHGAIAQIRGPWCSSGDWWQADRAWARTEWDIALATGGLYRLLRTGDAWSIEGEYD
jgi:protein ImuB